jgi:predicted KAP-like P-loop ATPase
VPPIFRLSADAPINSGASDLLGRAGFAASCAEAITNWQDDASLVIAIWGDWGSGKSSLKNLIVENLGGLDQDRRPAIVEFNPWQVIDSDQLLNAFFAEIGKVLERPIGKEDKESGADPERKMEGVFDSSQSRRVNREICCHSGYA